MKNKTSFTTNTAILNKKTIFPTLCLPSRRNSLLSVALIDSESQMSANRRISEGFIHTSQNLLYKENKARSDDMDKAQKLFFVN